MIKFGYVYLIEDVRQTVMKIGISEQPRRRFEALNRTAEQAGIGKIRLVSLIHDVSWMVRLVENAVVSLPWLRRLELPDLGEGQREWMQWDKRFIDRFLLIPRVDFWSAGFCKHGFIRGPHGSMQCQECASLDAADTRALEAGLKALRDLSDIWFKENGIFPSRTLPKPVVNVLERPLEGRANARKAFKSRSALEVAMSSGRRDVKLAYIRDQLAR